MHKKPPSTFNKYNYVQSVQKLELPKTFGKDYLAQSCSNHPKENFE